MSNTEDGGPSKSSADASSLGNHPAPVPAASAHRPILSFGGGRGPYSARGRGRGRGRGTIDSERGSVNAMVSSPGYISRRGRGRGGAIGVSAGSNSWRRGQPLTTTISAGPFASSNSWVRPNDDNTEQNKDAKTTKNAATAVDLALASIEDNANDKEGPMVPPQNKTVPTDAIDGNNTDGTNKSKKPILKGGPKPAGGNIAWKRKNDEDRTNDKRIGQPKQQPPPPRQRKTGRNTNRPVTKAPAAKRIRLGKGSTDTTDQNDTDGTGDNDNDKPEGQAKRHGGDGTTLTAFAYRETGTVGRGRGRGHNRGRGRGNTNTSSGNIGLVRVKSELQSTTKICPTFARGVNCDNEYCRKRHDVPPECARPLCSFFQRHGQCRKGDECPFAHVKVDPRAAICSSFRLLGYCEDPNCTFKHVAQK